MFQSITNHKSSPPQRFSQISKTQKKGYITAQQRIEQIMLAGKNLREYRENQYDFKTESDIDFSLNDPTRSKNFDLADASMLKNQTEANLIASKKAAEKKVIEDSRFNDDPVQHDEKKSPSAAIKNTD